MTERMQDKARRYLAQGRLHVRTVTGDTVQATCRGDGARYELGHDEPARWWCSCPAPRDCAHLVALRLVTVAGGAS